MGFVVRSLWWCVRKNVLLTVWLLLPLIVVGGLTWWIFRSFAAGPPEKLPPVGAGAGDAGGANAIGLWLRPDAVDPRDWAGGVELTFPVDAVPDRDAPGTDVSAILVVGGPEAPSLRVWRPHRRADEYVLTLTRADLEGVSGVYVSPAPGASTAVENGVVGVSDASGRALRQLLPASVETGETARSDPLAIDLGISSVYADEPGP